MPPHHKNPRKEATGSCIEHLSPWGVYRGVLRLIVDVDDLCELCERVLEVDLAGIAAQVDQPHRGPRLDVDLCRRARILYGRGRMRVATGSRCCDFVPARSFMLVGACLCLCFGLCLLCGRLLCRQLLCLALQLLVLQPQSQPLLPAVSGGESQGVKE